MVPPVFLFGAVRGTQSELAGGMGQREPARMVPGYWWLWKSGEPDDPPEWLLAARGAGRRGARGAGAHWSRDSPRVLEIKGKFPP